MVSNLIQLAELREIDARPAVGSAGDNYQSGDGRSQLMQ